MIQYAKTISKQVKQISDSLFEVLGYSVKFQSKKGRTLLICNCQNHTRFVNESPICSHKTAVLIFLSENKFRDRLDKLITEYEKFKELKLPVSIDLMISDLNDIKNLK